MILTKPHLIEGEIIPKGTQIRLVKEEEETNQGLKAQYAKDRNLSTEEIKDLKWEGDELTYKSSTVGVRKVGK